MNVYDSHRMTDLLTRDSYVETAAPEDADLIILNTCHIREKAAEKSIRNWAVSASSSARPPVRAAALLLRWRAAWLRLKGKRFCAEHPSSTW